MAVPNAPVLSAIEDGLKQLTLTWTKPTDGGADIDVYKVYTGTILVDTVTGSDVLTYVDTGLGDGVTVEYTVLAHNVEGDGAASNAESGTTFNKPGAPTALTAVDGNTTATLSWTAPTFNFGSAILYYKVYRGVETGVLVSIGTSATTSYSDTGLTNGTTYFYAVTGSNVVGEGVKSSETTAKPEAPGSTESSNRFLTVCGAISESIFSFSGGHSWTLDVPTNKTVLGINAMFSTSDNLTGKESIVVNLVNKTVKVYSINAEATNLYDVVVVVYYK
jgi:hypothetical protein